MVLGSSPVAVTSIEDVVHLFDEYATLASEAKYEVIKTIQGKEIKILTPKKYFKDYQ